MQIGSPYDEFGRILSAGGELGVAVDISSGFDEGQVSARLSSRVGNIDPGIILAVIALGKLASDSGSVLNGMLQYERPTLDVIPVQPLLFGDDFAGKRLKIGGNVVDPDGKSIARIDLTYPDIPTLSDIWDDALQELERRIKASPGGFSGENFDRMSGVMYQILYAERRY